MQKFGIGDRVRVIFITTPLAFRISAVSEGKEGEYFYTGEDAEGRWFGEDRLDYDLAPKERELIGLVEHDLQAVMMAQDALRSSANELARCDSPRSLTDPLFKRLGELMDWERDLDEVATR